MPDTDSKSFFPESDFTVIGASFAGSLLASRLTKYGRVALFDKTQPGTRLKCAGGIKAEEFKRLEIEIPHVKAGNIIISAGGKKSGFKSQYVVADRRDIDAAVLKKAMAAGAVFRKAEYVSHSTGENTVTLRHGGETAEFRYKKLILAKGFLSRQGGSFHGASYVEIIESRSKYGDSLYFKILEDRIGYCWIFPLPEGKINIGIGSFSETPFSPSDFKKFKEEQNIDGRVVCKGGGRIPMHPAMSVMKGDVTLFGDSAGMVLALNGEGLRYISRMSGLWAECIAGKKNLNFRWVFSRTFARLYVGSAAMRIIIFIEKHFKRGLYSFLCGIGPSVRKLIRR
ncbi:MAG: NAD(P)/FAD-dependent oxidoreductase [Victivallales bacterium]